MIHFGNFHLATAADFIPCELPTRPPDFYSFSGSTYWDLGDRVIRWSDHWGRVASCHWLYEGWRLKSSRCLAAECRYEDFRPLWLPPSALGPADIGLPLSAATA